MSSLGYEVGAISSPGALLDAFAEREGIAAHPIAMARRITPVSDLVSLGRLWRLLRRIRPQIVHAHTPKGGLLGTLAAWLAGVPVRIYHIHGLPFLTARIQRRLLHQVERTSCRLAVQVYCVSRSVRDLAVAEGLCPAEKIAVLLGGSINGVDAAGRFDPVRCGTAPAARSATNTAFRARRWSSAMSGGSSATRDWRSSSRRGRSSAPSFPRSISSSSAQFESHDRVPPEVERILRTAEACHLTGQVDDPAPCYAAMDLLVLPSYREGLGYALIEAGAMMLPVVATRIPGCVDAVEDGTTGSLVPPRDATALTGAIPPLSQRRRPAAHPREGRTRARPGQVSPRGHLGRDGPRVRTPLAGEGSCGTRSTQPTIGETKVGQL